jgi:hypothetical protein
VETILGLAGLIGIVVGIVALIRPVALLRINDRKKAGLVLLSGLILTIVAASITKVPEKGNETAVARASSSQKDSISATTADKPELAMPAEQAAFIKAVVWARQAYKDAPNKLAKGGVRSQRRTRICQALNSTGASGWLGRIAKLGSNNNGKGVLTVEIADNVQLTTWNNALSDIGTNTLIDPGSALFVALAQMKKGQQVIFSGRFFPDETDCVAEQSMSLSGSMREPEFVFRFNEVKER